ncbi:MAG: glutamine amidotransferase [Epsilonproteobacteria bacterium]|nr:glutamine amidotransferase [Campylobacterota bacterium]
MQEVLIYLENEYADWEISHIGSQITSSNKYIVKYVAKTKDMVISMSGLRMIPDVSAEDVVNSNISQSAMLVLCGGMYWSKANFINEEAKNLVDLFLKNNKPVAAICDATAFLACHGYLDDTPHTGNSIGHIIQVCPSYKGHSHYINEQCVASESFITANGTGEYEFVREIVKRLEEKPAQEIDAWYHFRKKGLAAYINEQSKK